MEKYLLDFEKIKLIGDISDMTVTGIHKHCEGDLLNSPLHYLCVNISFNKLQNLSGKINPLFTKITIRWSTNEISKTH